MNDMAPAPTVAELQAIGEALIKYWPGAKDRLQIYGGLSSWSMAHRDIKLILKELIGGYREGAAVKVPMHFREKALAFAAMYGVETRSTAAEPLSVKRDIRFTRSEWESYETAASQLNVTVAFFLRAAGNKAVEDLKRKEGAA